MSLLNWTTKRLSVATSSSPSSGSANTTTGGTFGRSGGGGGASAFAVGEGGLASATCAAFRYVIPLRVSTRPTTSIHRPVSRLSPASSSQPDPFGFLPDTHTANASSLITQSDDIRCDRIGRSPYRFLPRNCPTT